MILETTRNKNIVRFDRMGEGSEILDMHREILNARIYRMIEVSDPVRFSAWKTSNDD